MKHLTKKAYSRKALTIGVAVFSVIALTATGLAAFILSSSAEKGATGGINVGGVSEKNVNINFKGLKSPSSDQLKDDYKFSFNPTKDDNKGRVRYDGANSEQLSCIIEGTIDPAEVVSKVTVRLDVLKKSTDSDNWVVDEEANSKFKSAATTGNYITLPECFGKDVEVTTGEGDYSYTTSDNKMNFTLKIAFGWGTAFNNMNPGNYYDEDVEGKAKSDATMKTEMAAFTKALTGSDNPEADTTLNYKITIKADTAAKSE